MKKYPLFLLLFLLILLLSGVLHAREKKLIAVFPTWEPYGYVKNGEARGFEIEIFQAVMNNLNISVDFVHQPWKRCLYSVKNGYADVVISALKVEERTHYLYYPEEPISKSETAFFTRTDSKIVFNGSFEGLRNYTIGVTSGFSYGPAFDSSDYLKTDPSTETQAVIVKVLLSRIELGAGNMAVIKSIARKRKAVSKIRFLTPLLHSQNLYAGFSRARGHEKLTIAFSKASRVMMSRGLMSFSSSTRIAAPTCTHSSSFAGSSAGMEELYGRLIPRASMAEAIVLAVYMPPQAPAPGQLLRTMSARCSSLMDSARNCPYD